MVQVHYSEGIAFHVDTVLGAEALLNNRMPAPLEPSKPITSPPLATKVNESTAVNVPKRRVRVSISTIGVITAEFQKTERCACGSQLHTLSS
jgi:hypothetical protein